MPVPAGFEQNAYGAWLAPDGSGPYAIEFDAIGAPSYTQLPCGFYTRDDGAGPYSYDADSNTYTLATGVFGSL